MREGKGQQEGKRWGEGGRERKREGGRLFE